MGLVGRIILAALKTCFQEIKIRAVLCLKDNKGFKADVLGRQRTGGAIYIYGREKSSDEVQIVYLQQTTLDAVDIHRSFVMHLKYLL
jgi:hypothetical protein